MRKLLPVVIATLMIACKKNNDNPNAVNTTDKAFLVQVYQAGREEIRTGQLALNRSNDQSVRVFAQNLIAGYIETQSDLIAVANKVGFPLTDTVSVRAQSVSALNDLSGYSFDTAYTASRLRSQMAVLSIYQNELNNGNNTYIRYYFLQKHLDKVRAFFQQADSLSRAL